MNLDVSLRYQQRQELQKGTQLASGVQTQQRDSREDSASAGKSAWKTTPQEEGKTKAPVQSGLNAPQHAGPVTWPSEIGQRCRPPTRSVNQSWRNLWRAALPHQKHQAGSLLSHPWLKHTDTQRSRKSTSRKTGTVQSQLRAHCNNHEAVTLGLSCLKS